MRENAVLDLTCAAGRDVTVMLRNKDPGIRPKNRKPPRVCQRAEVLLVTLWL